MAFRNLVLLTLATVASAWLPSSEHSTHAKRTLEHESGLWTQNHTVGTGTEKRWLPGAPKIRGVNLGSLFIIEPWMANDAWNSMGCGGQRSEFDCMRALGQERGDAAFQKHWNTWITEDDIQQIADLGLNTIRIPVGYWMREDIVWRDSEWFPKGGFPYLERVCNWAANRGLYIIIDLHGAPGAQVANNAFTGQFASTPGFYVDYQYERAYKFLEWMTNIIHTNNNFRNVGALQVMNEPVHTWEQPGMAASLISQFYPNAWNRIRAVENRLNIGAYDRVHIQMMNEKWGSGNPNQNLNDLWFAFYDDHRYIKWAGVNPSRADYLRASCYDDRGGNWPVVVGEWSLSVADSAEWNDEFTLNRADAAAWYKRWWAAQVIAYEKQQGWIFWTWKANWIAGRNEWRWAYQAAVAAGAIPRNPNEAHTMGACNGV